MKTLLMTHWEKASASYWFVPSIMTIGAILLASSITRLDSAIGAEWLDGIDWLYANKPDGARALLSTIAGSMIGVAGVTFSITIAAVSYATSQFGPRLLTNFMQDRGNQITLGTFIATFIYCLLVLRTIRSPDESTGAEAAVSFVPHIGLLIGFGLALASIGVLIFFIHHVPESIHASNVIAGIGRELHDALSSIFPDDVGTDRSDEEDYAPARDVPDDFGRRCVRIAADGTGYVQYVDQPKLMRLAREHDLLLRVEYRPGDFVSAGKPLLRAYPPDHVDDDARDALRSLFGWGRQRTQRQDLLFLVNELAEIASRALSPGTNDPFTAITCFDWLGSVVLALAHQRLPGSHRYDEDGRLRVIVRPVSFEEVVATAFDAPRPYAEGDRNAARHLMKIYGDVAVALDDPDRRAVLQRRAKELMQGARQTLTHSADVDAVERRYRIVQRLLTADEETRQALADEHAWIDGSG